MPSRTLPLLTLAALALTACATPLTTLKHPKTGQVATCGGDKTGSLAGGAIGYHIQKDSADACVANYQKQGFTVVDTQP